MRTATIDELRDMVYRLDRLTSPNYKLRQALNQEIKRRETVEAETAEPPQGSTQVQAQRRTHQGAQCPPDERRIQTLDLF